MKIACFGDFVLDQKFIDSPNFQSFCSLFNSCDLVTFNLETVISDNELMPSDKACNFKASSICMDLFRNAITPRIICNIANNHILDYGVRGLSDTIHNIERLKNISYTGIYPSDTCIKPCIVKSKKFIVLGASYEKICFSNFKALSPDNSLIAQVKSLRLSCDYLIVHLHIGEELSPLCSPRLKDLSHKLVDSGADVIIFHHPHVIQGIENYKNKLILYSLGNFQIDSIPDLEITKYSSVFIIDVNNKTITYREIPIYINNGIPELIPVHSKQMEFFCHLRNTTNKLCLNATKLNYYIIVSYCFWICSACGWKMRHDKGEQQLLIKFLKWLFSPKTLSMVIFRILNILILGTYKKYYDNHFIKSITQTNYRKT